MKCRRVGICAEVFAYEVGKGMEDGFELWSDVVTKGWICTDSLITVKQNESILCPYISHRRGRTFIRQGDYIIIDEDGSKHVCGEDKVHSRYTPVEE